MSKKLGLSRWVLGSWQKISLAGFALALPALVSCNASEDDDDSASGGASNPTATGGSFASGSALGTGGLFNTGGVFNTGGAPARGGTFGTGGVATTGGVLSTGGTLGKGGTSTGGTSSAQGGRIPVGGASAQAGIGGIPGAGPDGKSPYQRECHGETAMCVDVASLRCLGIRDGMAVAGYSCSNPCQTDADCSRVPSSAEAAPACVDFVTQKHCLLLCQQAGKSFSCPTGMGCYVYPGSTTGYCLWR